MKDIKSYHGVWVFAEQRNGSLARVSLELLGEGRILADRLNVPLSAFLLGNEMDALADELTNFNVDTVYYADHALLKNYTSDAYAKVFGESIEQYKPEIVLFGATHIGRDLAPKLAARIETGLTADCTKLEIEAETGHLLQTRPAFGGNLMATIICANHRPQMATVRPGVMSMAQKNPKQKGEIIKIPVALKESDIKIKVIDIVNSVKRRVSLPEANIIVTGGRGLGTPEGFDLIRKLADTLGGEVGSSRAAVDEGWISKDHQVGQTGTTVRPNIYIACGVSGAIQHVAGMQESDIIIAINKDSEAPIFKIADYGIVGDLYQVIPEIISAYAQIIN